MLNENQSKEMTEEQMDKMKEPELLAKIEQIQRQIEAQKQSENSLRHQEQESKKAEEETKLKAEANIKQSLTKNQKDVDLESLSNTELLNIIADVFETGVDAKAKLAISESSKPLRALESKLNKIEQYLIQREAASGVEAARSKFSDFDNYKDQISKIFDTYPGINPEDAYILAKSKASKGIPPQKVVETEKPDNFATRFSKANTDEEEVTTMKKRNNDDIDASTPRKNFRDALQKAAEKVISSRQK